MTTQEIQLDLGQAGQVDAMVEYDFTDNGVPYIENVRARAFNGQQVYWLDISDLISSEQDASILKTVEEYARERDL